MRQISGLRRDRHAPGNVIFYKRMIHMDLEKQIEQAAGLLKKTKADEWEVMALATEQLSIAISGEEVDKFQQSASQGLALRVVSKGKLGFSYLMGSGEGGALETAVNEALAAAKASDFEDTAGLGRPLPLPQAPEVFDPALKDEPLEAKKERALVMSRAARQADPRVQHVHPAEISESHAQVRLITSHGVDLSQQSTSCSAMANAVAAENGQQEMAWEYDVRRFLADLDPVHIGTEAGRRAVASLGAEPVADGQYDVILESQVTMDFLGLLGSSLQGDNVVKGRSLLASKIDQKVVSDLVSLMDDGLLPKGVGSGAFDDEGTPTSTKVLVESGVIRSFVFDRPWAARHGVESTGNAVRPGLKAPPQVGFSNLYLKPGQGSLEDLASGLDRGLVITEVLGAHTADPVSGQFSLGASGFLVESGKITRPVKSIAVAGQVVELFDSVKAVGGDLRFLGGTGAPSLLVAGMSVSGPGQG
jgi:PmbA protein